MAHPIERWMRGRILRQLRLRDKLRFVLDWLRGGRDYARRRVLTRAGSNFLRRWWQGR